MLRRTFVKAVAAFGVALAGSMRGIMDTDAKPVTPTSANTHDMVITRQFDAPVERVWQAWIDAEDVKRWWGPKAFTAPVAEMDVCDGETSFVCMRSPEGQDLCNTWTYQKVVPHELLEFIQRFADEDGNAIDPVGLGLPPEIPAEVRHVVTFNELANDRTELTVTEYGYPVAWIVEVSAAGMNECLDKMESLVSGT